MMIVRSFALQPLSLTIAPIEVLGIGANRKINMHYWNSQLDNKILLITVPVVSVYGVFRIDHFQEWLIVTGVLSVRKNYFLYYSIIPCQLLKQSP